MTRKSNSLTPSDPKIVSVESGLYVTATPIGNLGDITIRALETLKAADLILCEDTRHTARLCQAYQITTQRQAYHDHNGAQVRPAILERLQKGAVICLVSDAGTPLISDPGYKLVEEARALAINVTALPGPCAAIAALSIAGIASNQFLFAGFPPHKAGAREQFFRELTNVKGSLVFYESASRLYQTLEQMANIFGNRKVVIARELTKKFEQIVSAPLAKISDHLEDITPKGEIVILLGPCEDEEEAIDIDAMLERVLGEMSVKEAATMIAQATNTPRREVYARALAIKGR